MAKVVVLEPHNDDAVLFSCFNALRENATVITVLRSHIQEARGDGITADQRTAESERAVRGVLNLPYVQWPFRDDNPDWSGISQMILALKADRLYVPAYELDRKGHEHHDRLYQCVHECFEGEVVQYLTYTKAGKSKWGIRVPYMAAWVPLKMKALLCFESQLEHPLQVEHFLRSYREFVA